MTTLTKENDVCILKVEGELDKGSVNSLQEIVDRCLIEDACDFVIDLAECTRVDSAALEAFTWLSRECEERLGMCKLCNLSDSMETVFEITRLKQQLQICLTLDEAMAALKQT